MAFNCALAGKIGAVLTFGGAVDIVLVTSRRA